MPELTREQATTRMAVLAATITHWMVETGKIGEFERWLTDQGQLPPLDEKMRTNLAATLEAIHSAGEPDCELRVPRPWLEHSAGAEAQAAGPTDAGSPAEPGVPGGS